MRLHWEWSPRFLIAYALGAAVYGPAILRLHLGWLEALADMLP